MDECAEMSPGLPPSHGPTPSQTALQHTQLMLTGSQLAGVRPRIQYCNSVALLAPLNTLLPSLMLFLNFLILSSTFALLLLLLQLTALLPAQQQLLLQQAQAQLLAAAVQQSNAAHAAHAAHAAAQANQQAQAAAAANQQAQQHQQAGQAGQQGQGAQEQSAQSVSVPPQLALSQPIQLTAQVPTAKPAASFSRQTILLVHLWHISSFTFLFFHAVNVLSLPLFCPFHPTLLFDSYRNFVSKNVS